MVTRGAAAFDAEGSWAIDGALSRDVAPDKARGVHVSHGPWNLYMDLTPCGAKVGAFCKWVFGLVEMVTIKTGVSPPREIEIERRYDLTPKPHGSCSTGFGAMKVGPLGAAVSVALGSTGMERQSTS